MSILFIAFVATVISTQSDCWSYLDQYGPTSWPKQYPQHCNGSKQSPIDIDSIHTTYDPALQSGISNSMFNYLNVSTPNKWLLSNTGETVSISVRDQLQLRGFGLTGSYYMYAWHFHWGDSNLPGSEHTIDGYRYPLEMHIIFYSGEFNNFSAAMASSKPGALAVFSVLFKEGAENQWLKELIGDLSTIALNTTITVPINPIDLSTMLPANDKCGRAEFYRYDGSLTTPTCDEIVTWTVFRNPDDISGAQLAAFRSVYYDYITNSTSQRSHIQNNYRPVQPLNGRTVYRSYIAKDKCDIGRMAGSAPSTLLQSRTLIHFVIALISMIIVGF